MASVEVKLYALFREVVGSDIVRIECGGVCSVKRLLEELYSRYPRLERVASSLDRVIVLDQGGRILREDDTVDSRVELLPPSAGGSRIIVRVVKGEDLSLDDLFYEMDTSDRTGASLFFVGTVRRNNRGGRVHLLEYEAHERLEDKLRDIAGEVLSKYNLDSVSVVHYIGKRRPGDLTFIAAVKAVSRKEAFNALIELVERVKHEAPIWKREVRDDGVYWITGNKLVKIE